MKQIGTELNAKSKKMKMPLCVRAWHKLTTPAAIALGLLMPRRFTWAIVTARGVITEDNGTCIGRRRFLKWTIRQPHIKNHLRQKYRSEVYLILIAYSTQQDRYSGQGKYAPQR